MKKFITLIMCVILMFSFAACGNGEDSSSLTGTSASSPDQSSSSGGTVSSTRSEDYVSLWNTDLIKNETVMLQEDETGWISGGLLFEPTEIIEVKNYDLTVSFDASDYEMNGRYMERTENSKMPYMSYKIVSCSDLSGTNLGSMGGLVFTETKEIASYLLNVTYKYDASKYGFSFRPENKSETLSNFQRKMREKRDVKLFLYGDSIGAGCHASSVLDYNPHMPIWGKAVANELSTHYGTKVDFYNGSTGGWTSGDGAKNIAQRISVVPYDAPDIAIIEFGMNDGSAKVSANTYAGNIKTIISTIRESAPDCDIVLISTIKANPLGSQDKKLTGSYHDENVKICEEYERCVTVNMTALCDELYSKKDGLDLLANNINHPNDFLVRCFVMNILDVIEG